MRSKSNIQFKSVKEINTITVNKLHDVFTQALPVVGKVQDWKVIENSFVIFKLADHDDPSYSIAGLIPTHHWLNISQELTNKNLGDMTSVVAWGRPSVQKTNGTLRFLVSRMKIQAPPREEVRRIGLEKLKSKGIAGANRALTFPELPLRIGLLAPAASAGLQDFIHQLKSSQIGFGISYIKCPMNGPTSKTFITNAIRVISRENLDTLAICRGGGAKSDLSVFDDNEIALEICKSPVPIITGIGHRSDTTLADLVAHHSCITPTAAASYLVNRARNYSEHVSKMCKKIVEVLAPRTLAILGNELEKNAAILKSKTRSSFLLSLQNHERQTETLHRSVGFLSSDYRQLSSCTDKLTARLKAESSRMGLFVENTKRHSGAAIESNAESISGTHTRLLRASPALAGENTNLKILFHDFSGLAKKAIHKKRQALDQYQRFISLRDPKLLLKQGLAFIRRRDGKIVKDAASLKPGQRFHIQLRDGLANCRVQHKTNNTGVIR
jgi:exodeoxyribonuclease VII large subunit